MPNVTTLAGDIYQLMCISRVLCSTQGVIVCILGFRYGNLHDLVYSGNTSTVIYTHGDMIVLTYK